MKKHHESLLVKNRVTHFFLRKQKRLVFGVLEKKKTDILPQEQ